MDGRVSMKSADQSDLSFQDLASNMRLVAVTLNADAELTYCNEYFLELTGWALEEVIGRNWFERCLPPGADEVQGVFTALLKDLPKAWHHENEILRKSGDRLLIRWNNSVLRDALGNIHGIASIGEDITEHRLLERELLEASARERRHLAAELHDGLSQQLYGAKLLTEGLETVAKTARRPITDDLHQLSSILATSMDTCHRIAQGLSPLADVRGGIIQGLRELTQMPVPDGLAVECEIIDAAPMQLSLLSRDHLYRLAQEALANSVKHASATRIQVIFNVQPTLVTLTVRDNGIGLAQQPPNSKSLGLKLMRYRANMMRAKLTLTRIEPHGTCMTCICAQP